MRLLVPALGGLLILKVNSGNGGGSPASAGTGRQAAAPNARSAMNFMGLFCSATSFEEEYRKRTRIFPELSGKEKRPRGQHTPNSPGIGIFHQTAITLNT